tara:strand:- start:10096 stop:10401 length:306 start_codon:yes stop_codon:yes gene_type:complete
MGESWELIRNITQVIGIIFIPIFAWVLHTIIGHSKKLILLEERVSDTLNRRLTDLESKLNIFDDKMDSITVNLATSTHTIEQLEHKLDSILSILSRATKGD